jgi:hypothetical protein
MTGMRPLNLIGAEKRHFFPGMAIRLPGRIVPSQIGRFMQAGQTMYMIITIFLPPSKAVQKVGGRLAIDPIG